MAEHTERFAEDGDGDIWGYGHGRWKCLTNAGTADDDESLSAEYPPAAFYVPAPPPSTVAFDLTDPDVRHALTQALEDFADRQQTMAATGDIPEKRLTWAAHAKSMLDQAEAAR